MFMPAPKLKLPPFDYTVMTLWGGGWRANVLQSTRLKKNNLQKHLCNRLAAVLDDKRVREAVNPDTDDIIAGGVGGE